MKRTQVPGGLCRFGVEKEGRPSSWRTFISHLNVQSMFLDTGNKAVLGAKSGLHKVLSGASFSHFLHDATFILQASNL